MLTEFYTPFVSCFEEVSFGLVHCSTVFALLSEGILFNLTYCCSGDYWILPFGLGGECYSSLSSADFESAFDGLY